MVATHQADPSEINKFIRNKNSLKSCLLLSSQVIVFGKRCGNYKNCAKTATAIKINYHLNGFATVKMAVMVP